MNGKAEKRLTEIERRLRRQPTGWYKDIAPILADVYGVELDEPYMIWMTEDMLRRLVKIYGDD